MQNRIETMRKRLEDALSPRFLDITDNSAAHAGHAGAQTGKGHYTVRIQCDTFAGKSLLACHRDVYHALGDMMQEDIHALRIEVI